MLENLREIVKNKVTEKRYVHTLGVEEKAVELAKKYDVDEEKARIAAILHDIAKSVEVGKLEEVCRKYFSNELTEEDIKITEILHGFVGYIIVKEELKIEDEEILEAIKYHTIGKKGLSKLGRIIYIADAIEKNRVYPNVHKIREIVDRNLDDGIIYEIDKKIEYLESIGGKIHKNTLEMGEWLKNFRR
ncbi:putative nicotinate-nucleotide adenylyltransferase [Fusobacterium necrogenes]|uniref:bis(5'-nucleosyl)-tetraphosphatase (symmetrical) n=1 Tax=Fusobacterium necrogenes TaxID=858 RepID=A0A377GW14_9FUSO|nr:bis(5'-nucleosyl)-tetraphosphatase (symmetrical) YqeK [Fusobacterium necrogenes]STO30721.1 putative nicotinate-nucleotide adenylyltransferase [Fusobacterium necrogenes]